MISDHGTSAADDHGIPHVAYLTNLCAMLNCLLLSMVMSAKLSWEPLHDAHSIEVAAVVIIFSEPMTDVVWRRVVRDAEPVCKAGGLAERNVNTGIQFTVAAGAVTPNTPVPIESVSFVRSRSFEVLGGGMQKGIAESLTIDKTTLTFQSFDYSRWKNFFERLQMLLAPALRGALHAVTIANLRLEYRDQFRFDGPDAPLAITLLRRDSPLIAPHVFDRANLWHSHTGFLEDAEGCQSRLIQINIDANEAMRVGDATKFHIVTVTTAVQNNLKPAVDSLENDGNTAKLHLAMLDSMHARSKHIFRELISDEVAKRVGME